MQRWEYVMIDFGAMPKGRDDLTAFLNDYGSRGWELVSIGTGPTVFKKLLRPKPPSDVACGTCGGGKIELRDLRGAPLETDHLCLDCGATWISRPHVPKTDKL